MCVAEEEASTPVQAQIPPQNEVLFINKGLGVLPMANFTYFDQRLAFHPKALVGVGSNSNVFAQETDPKSSAYYHGIIGLLTTYRFNAQNNLSVDGELEARRYTDSEVKDVTRLTGGQACLDYLYQEQNNNRLKLHGGFARFDDPEIQTGMQIKRQTADGDISAAINGMHARLVIGGTMLATDYLEDGIGFTKDSRDNTVSGGNLRLGYTMSHNGFIYALAKVERVTYKEDVQFNNSSGYTFGAGLQQSLGERSSLLLEAGMMSRTYDKNFNDDPAYDDKKVVAPYGECNFVWPWETGSQVSLRGFSRLNESLTANTAWLTGGALDGRLRVADRTFLFAGVDYFLGKDDGAAAGAEVEKRTTTDATLGLDYQMNRGALVRLKGTYTDSKSETSNNFKRTLVGLDIAIAF